MLSSTYLLFENIKFCITETNFRVTSLGIIFRTYKKIPVKFLDTAFKKSKQKHFLLIISRNLHILMKCSFIDICVIIILFEILLKTHCSQKQPSVVFCKKRCSIKFSKFHRKSLALESLFIKITFLK